LHLIIQINFMKHTILIIGLLPLFINTMAQEPVQDSSIKYKTRIFEATIYGKKAKIEDVYLVKVGDSVISISSSLIAFNSPSAGDKSIKYVLLSDIESIRIARKGHAGRGAVIGLAIGAGIGLLSGFAMGSDKEGTFWRTTAGEKALAFSILLGGTGALIGFIAGAVSGKKYVIGGNKQQLQQMNASLLERIYAAPK
jgi:hypothetical protein